MRLGPDSFIGMTELAFAGVTSVRAHARAGQPDTDEADVLIASTTVVPGASDSDPKLGELERLQQSIKTALDNSQWINDVLDREFPEEIDVLHDVYGTQIHEVAAWMRDRVREIAQKEVAALAEQLLVLKHDERAANLARLITVDKEVVLQGAIRRIRDRIARSAGIRFDRLLLQMSKEAPEPVAA